MCCIRKKQTNMFNSLIDYLDKRHIVIIPIDRISFLIEFNIKCKCNIIVKIYMECKYNIELPVFELICTFDNYTMTDSMKEIIQEYTSKKSVYMNIDVYNIYLNLHNSFTALNENNPDLFYHNCSLD